MKRFTRLDITHVLDHRIGSEEDVPRKGVLAVAGFDTKANPVVLLVDMNTWVVFHAQRPEKKYGHLLR